MVDRARRLTRVVHVDTVSVQVFLLPLGLGQGQLLRQSLDTTIVYFSFPANYGIILVFK